MWASCMWLNCQIILHFSDYYRFSRRGCDFRKQAFASSIWVKIYANLLNSDNFLRQKLDGKIQVAVSYLSPRTVSAKNARIWEQLLA